MKYIEVQFSISSAESFVKDLLANDLASIGFESFSDTTDETATPFSAFIPKKDYDEESLKNVLSNFAFAQGITFSAIEAEDKDWNEEWEKNCFQPFVIPNNDGTNALVVHASFHKNIPSAQHKILIDPKMAFGTGHHATTSMMVHYILDNDFEGKTVLDMGCGTAILSILAAQKGATKITAIDIDEWAYNNAIENIHLNNISNIEALCGDATLLEQPKFSNCNDIILANINRNILLNDLHRYVKTLKKGGLLFISGFYEADIPILVAECEKNGMKAVETRQEGDWRAVKLMKIAD